jgi:O-antigen ligase
VALLVLLPICALILFRYRQQLGFAQWGPAQMVRVASILLGGIVFLGSVPAKNSQIIQEGSGATALQRSFLRAASVTKPAEYSTGSFAVRAVMWKASARMLLAHPLEGVGAGAWEVHIPLYQQATVGMETDYYAHNEYLQLLGEYGLVVGGLFLAFLLAYLLLSAVRTWHLTNSGLQEAPLRAIVLACLLCLLTVSLAGFPLHLAGTGALFALCLAILAGSDHRLGIDESFYSKVVRWNPVHFRLGLALVLCAMVCAMYITLQAVRAEQNIVRAIQLGNGAIRAQKSGLAPSAERSAQSLRKLREGLWIAPHYRKLSSVAADQLAQSGDLVNALWVWESIVASRPYIAVVWSNMARGYAQLGQNERALESLQHWQQLQPGAPGLLALEVALLGLTGQMSEAEQKLTQAFDLGQYDYELVMTGYALGMQFQRWPLAIRSIEIRNLTWPEQSVDGNIRLGVIASLQAVLDKTGPQHK